MQDLDGLIAEREMIIHDLISVMNSWVEEFNRVTDNMIESLRTDDTEVVREEMDKGLIVEDNLGELE